MQNDGNHGPLFFITAGDPSGDIHAANLIREIRRLHPDARFVGLGGPHMARAGCEILYNLVENLALMWFLSVIINIGRVIKSQRIALDFIDAHHPDLIIFIDFPGFNLTLGRWLRKRPCKVAYYILPQVWAWFSFRWRRIRKFSHQHLTILPFEQSWYAKRGFEVDYVGHPLYDHLTKLSVPDDLRDRIGAKSEEKIIGLLPGSRRQEVLTKLPLMLKATREIRRHVPGIRAVISPPPALPVETVQKLVRKYEVPVDVLADATYPIMKGSDLCLVTSGTATLEVAYFETPMIVVYRIKWWARIVARIFMHVRQIGLINLVAGEEIVPDLLLGSDDYRRLARSAVPLLVDDEARERMLAGIRRVNAMVAHPGATARAAELLCASLDEKQAGVKSQQSGVRRESPSPEP